LDLAGANVLLNFKNVNHEKLVGDAFETMQSLVNIGKTFDLVIIDPPSFAKRKEEVELALKKYAELVDLGIRLVSRNGILLMASCSSRVANDHFFTLVENAMISSRRKYSLIEKTFHDIDHPITFPESSYLKSVYFQMDSSHDS